MLNHEKIQTTDAFWRNLSFIQSKLKISDFDISQRANLNWQKFIFSKNNSLSLPFHSVEKLSQFLSISTEQLILGSIGNRFESKVLEHQWANSLEDKYQLGTSSKSLTLRHLIKLAKRNNVYQQVISHFRLPEHLLEAKLDFDVSVQLLADIIDFIDSLVPLTENDFKFVAEQNAFYFQHSVFGNILKSAQNPIEIYENFVFLASYLETNWTYRIESTKNGKVLLNCYPTENLTDLFKRKDYSSENFTKFRILVTGALTRYLGLTDAKTRLTKSVHRNDSYSQFELDIANLMPLSQIQ